MVSAASTANVFHYEEMVVDTKPGIALFDITPQIREIVARSGVQEGCVNVLSRHTTTALTINEAEPRLMDDVRQFLARLVPASFPYLHNDLHFREAPRESNLVSLGTGMSSNDRSVPLSHSKLARGLGGLGQAGADQRPLPPHLDAVGEQRDGPSPPGWHVTCISPMEGELP